MNKMKMWFVGILLKKYALGYLVTGFKTVRGYKTQIATILACIVYVCKVFSFIPDELADQLIAILSGFGGASFLAKLKGYEDKIKEVAGEVKKEANKPIPAGPSSPA